MLISDWSGYDRHGRKVVVMRGGLSDPDTMKKDDEFKTSTMIMEVMINLPPNLMMN